MTKGFAAVQTDDARGILAYQLDAAAAHQRQLQDERTRVLERRQGWLDTQRRVDDVQAWLVELRGREHAVRAKVESAAKHLVQQRMKRAGMRWTELGARAKLHLRCALLNYDLLKQAA